ncbi:MAG: DUF1624 domain-containing protein [Lachnospiraceae bacterium]|nr:DUF1624 domain-containing protein [Lachnospiraceae bacterium]
MSDNTENKTITGRLHLLDAIRGAAMISMIAYHFCFDLFVMYKGVRYWSQKPPVFAWEQITCFCFIILSGFVWNYGKKKCIKRGLFVSFLGIVITVVTMIMSPELPIYYGVLFFLGAAMILMYPLSFILDKIPALPVLIASTLMFLLTFSIRAGYIGIYTTKLIKLPESLYRYDLLTPVGFPTKDFLSGDYFPLIPWIFMYTGGYALFRLIAKKESFKRIASLKLPVLSFIGRKSLWFYMVHQPVCLGILMLIMR